MIICVFFIAFIVLCIFLILIAVSSIHAYMKAYELYPLKLKKEELEKEITVLMMSEDNLKDSISSLKAEKEEVERLINRKRDYEKFFEQFDGEYEKKQHLLIELKEKNDELNKEYLKLVDKIQESQSIKNNLDQESAILTEKVSVLKIQQSELDSSIKTLSGKIDSLDSTILELEEKRDYLNKEKCNLETRLEELKVKNEEMHKRNEELSEEIKSNKNILDTLTRDVAAYKSTAEYFKEEKEQLEKKIAELTEKSNSLSNKVSEQEDSINKYNKEISKLAGKLAEKEELEKEYDNVKSSLEKSREALARLEGLVSEKEIENKKLEAYNVAGKYCWEDLDREYENKNITPVNQVKEKDWLDTFKSSLNDCNIKFSDRTINAFHTGLKVADSSPLVVLAGISGTGKSLLPQLYAKYAGMNFLSVAVQPRWDSPQDLLGFYNYMQSRFKATEFSRLLWQTDWYNNSAVVQRYGNSVGKIPMNLVLLDEMNLARVEYYFSDLLSKLEVRRIIDKDDPISRRVAEIEIESGTTGSEKNTRSLFVNNNTLFVGTMNEDETTQSLSDKVMDRANVLRFGKPGELQSKPLIDQFNNKYERNNYLTMDGWSSMCVQNAMSSKNESTLKDIVNSLNKTLEDINRPFAHRVWQSIDNYVRQYPNSNTDSKMFNNALSDQIEMKILPKLNGIEKDTNQAREALHNISNIINKVKDDALFKAFEAAVNDTSSSFFQWKGVAR